MASNKQLMKLGGETHEIIRNNEYIGDVHGDSNREEGTYKATLDSFQILLFQ
ncbi:hypothetical protein HYI36_18130 [Bacillus sp. Gen3]|nr:hypothetical protein [Bacillus sp. Gen3]